MKIYLIGSLRNPEIPNIAKTMRQAGLNVFDDWFAPGPEADDFWRTYEQGRGHTYLEALDGYAAKHIFEFDKHHIDTSDVGVLVLPCGKSAHLELGYMRGKGKRGYILLDEVDRWDVMYQFATGIYTNLDNLIEEIQNV